MLEHENREWRGLVITEQRVCALSLHQSVSVMYTKQFLRGQAEEIRKGGVCLLVLWCRAMTELVSGMSMFKDCCHLRLQPWMLQVVPNAVSLSTLVSHALEAFLEMGC